MDFGSPRLYEIELWSQSGDRIADISALCSNRHYTMQRNEAETLNFSLNLFEFESYCKNNLGGVDPSSLLAPYVTDVKVKRNGQYLFGAQVVEVAFEASVSADYMINVTCSGYLNLFKDRYVTVTYTQTEATAIATNIISLTQAQTNGSVGVTISPTQYATGVLRDRTYQRDNVKLKLQELTTLTDGNFDYAFSPMKVFQTYSQLGARRTDLNFIWGGSLSNVAGFELSRSGINLFNKIYGLGSGFGSDQLQSIQQDTASQLNYYIRERIDQFNSVVIQDTLDQNTLASLNIAKSLLELPVIIITGKEIGNNNFISIGDRIPLKVNDHAMLSSINGLYRVEQIDVTIDENDSESEIKLTFDSWGVNQSE